MTFSVWVEPLSAVANNSCVVLLLDWPFYGYALLLNNQPKIIKKNLSRCVFSSISLSLGSLAKLLKIIGAKSLKPNKVFKYDIYMQVKEKHL